MLNTCWMNKVGVRKGGNVIKETYEELCGIGTDTYDFVDAKCKGLTKLEVNGGCTQSGKPTPSTPIDIITNRGALKYKALGNNLLDSSERVIVVGKYLNNSGEVSSSPANCYFDVFVPVKASTAYTLSTSISLNYSNFMEYDANFVFIKRTLYGSGASSPAGKSTTHTMGETTAYVKVGSNISGATLKVSDVQDIKWMFSEGSTSKTYEAYRGGLVAIGSDTVRVGSKNLNEGVLEQKGYASTGGTSVSTTFCGTLCKIPVKAGQKYTVSFGNFSDGVSGVFVNTWKTDGSWNMRQAISSSGKLNYTIPDGVGEVNFTLYKTGGITIDDDSWMQVEYGNEATEYQPYELKDLKELELLLSVGDYVDVQDLVNGIVTRKVGVKVFDGTESGWSKGTNADTDGNAVFYFTLDDRANMDTSLKLMSSHYSFRGTVSYSNLKAGEMSITQTTRNVYFDGEGFSSLDEWKSYLTEQYKKGTPVIVVYPLASDVVESGMAKLQSNSGNSQILRSCEISGLEMNVCYLQKVEKPQGGGGLITFSVDGTEYQAEEGMTWEQWCNSEYNVDGYYIDSEGMSGGGSNYILPFDGYVTDGSGNKWNVSAVIKQDADLDFSKGYAYTESPSDVIVSGYDYTIVTP